MLSRRRLARRRSIRARLPCRRAQPVFVVRTLQSPSAAESAGAQSRIHRVRTRRVSIAGRSTPPPQPTTTGLYHAAGRLAAGGGRQAAAGGWWRYRLERNRGRWAVASRFCPLAAAAEIVLHDSRPRRAGSPAQTVAVGGARPGRSSYTASGYGGRAEQQRPVTGLGRHRSRTAAVELPRSAASVDPTDREPASCVTPVWGVCVIFQSCPFLTSR